ncbi:MULTISPECIES: type IV secretory system conjugative DNA transfer family protein [unclassified Chryseobacterium]|uniref:type IV secretory system conjugative DNA transfer family protein n=1 Tax=unclassified Chryseobacterium TaxID=2593645 RepID=UPI000D371E53|nr:MULTISPECIES: type IV secretion system DNA-binding domain-containing protein [unclassified Chryseobacterium]PTT73123.1 hypothetical protein DBR25_13570 [Chryseobacterium sp. HMWF001]PVV50747.1 DUF87 domain-containing protein [Chryseobacterium sp. HMWF035]
MESLIRQWNTQSLLWKITGPEVFWAGEYLLSESPEAREIYLKRHTHQIDSQLTQLQKGSSGFISKLRQRFITFEEFKWLDSGKGSGSVLVSNSPIQLSNSTLASLYWEQINQPNIKLLLPTSDDDEKNYLALLKKWLPSASAFFFSPKPVPVPLSALNRHLLITGRTGSGKTQFLQSLFWQLQNHTHLKEQSSLILLDPHGDLAEKLFGLRENFKKPERVWYIDPQLDEEKIPCLNPFWRRVADPSMIDLLSQQWAKAFSELIPEMGLSLQMEALLKPCLAVMFGKGNCGLSDLQVFMDDSQNHDWVELGKKSSFPVYRQFFESAFLNKKYAPTKLAVYTRLQLLLNNYVFYQMMNGESSIDLKKGMNQGKIILFNLSKGRLGEDCSKALGRFVSATLLSIALQRAFESESSRKPCYLFIDEFHNMANASMETVFSEARKYRLHLIVGTQTVGQLPASMKDMVLNNTAVKLVGLNGLPALKNQAGDIGVSYRDLQNLPPFYFYMKYDHHPALKIKAPDFLLRHPKKYFAEKEEMKNLKEYIIHKSGIYREHETELPDVHSVSYHNNEVTLEMGSTDAESKKSSQNMTNSTDVIQPESQPSSKIPMFKLKK